MENFLSGLTDGLQNVYGATDTLVEQSHQRVIDAIANTTEPVVPGTPAFCTIYESARPVLVFLKGMLFFKPKWQTLITGLVGGLDAICMHGAPLTAPVVHSLRAVHADEFTAALAEPAPGEGTQNDGCTFEKDTSPAAGE